MLMDVSREAFSARASDAKRRAPASQDARRARATPANLRNYMLNLLYAKHLCMFQLRDLCVCLLINNDLPLGV